MIMPSTVAFVFHNTSCSVSAMVMLNGPRISAQIDHLVKHLTSNAGVLGSILCSATNFLFFSFQIQLH
jgi:hypothetical protein